MSLSNEALAYYIGGATPVDNKRSSFDRLESIKEAGAENHSSEFANSLNETFRPLALPICLFFIISYFYPIYVYIINVNS